MLMNFIAQDLLKKLICKKEKRINAEMALNHPFFRYSAWEDDIPDEDASLLRYQLQKINRFNFFFLNYKIFLIN